MKRLLRALVLFLPAVVVATPAATAAAGAGSAAEPGGPCKVAYSVPSDWYSGFTGAVSITNTGTTPIDGWTLTFSFPGNQKISNGWGATWTQTSATAMSWNRTIAP